MDVERLLTELRVLSAELLKDSGVYEGEDEEGGLRWYGDVGGLQSKAQELAQSFQDLDNWMKRSSFIPQDWNRK